MLEVGETVTELKVGNESFLVASMIDRCPKVMMLRELVKNAVEAAERAPIGEGRVEISTIVIGGARKLAIWNSGPGMSAEELFRMCDIASSIRKQNSLDRNFGMGAKVATLPSNRHGVRYRSCAGGRVHEVVIGQRDGVYGRLRRPDSTGRLVDVFDATEAAFSEGRSLVHDWTEVVLLGMRADQDTALAPYDGAPAVAPWWVGEDLGYRFFRLPPSVEVILVPSLSTGQSGGLFEPLAQRAGRHYSRYEAVELSDGIIVHYLYNAPVEGATDLRTEGASPNEGAAGLVFDDEIYMPVRGWRWLQGAPIFGIPFGAASISVFIELPASARVVPDAYRQFLRYGSDDQAHVEAANFAPLVRQHRPAWLLALIEEMAPRSKHVQSVRTELDQLLRRLRVSRRFWFKVAPLERRETQSLLETISRPITHGVEAGKQPSSNPPPLAPEMVQETEPAPMIVSLRGLDDIASRGMQPFAARYYPETHQLFVNCLYPAILQMGRLLEQELSGMTDHDSLTRICTDAAEYVATLRVGRMLAYAMSKRDCGWATEDVRAAMSPACLTVAADDVEDALAAARDVARASLISLVDGRADWVE